MSNREIADKIGCDKRTVGAVLAKYNIKQEDVELFKENRADIYAGVIQKIVTSIDSKVVENASLRDRATAVGILQDKERLERGQSTANVANLHSIASRAIKALNKAGDSPSATD